MEIWIFFFFKKHTFVVAHTFKLQPITSREIPATVMWDIWSYYIQSEEEINKIMLALISYAIFFFLFINCFYCATHFSPLQSISPLSPSTHSCDPHDYQFTQEILDFSPSYLDPCMSCYTQVNYHPKETPQNHILM